MNLVHTAIRYQPAIGGVEEYVRSVCEGLVDRGHDVSVFTSELEQHSQKLRLQEPAQENIRGVHISRLHATYVPGLSGYPVLLSLFPKLLRERADITHGHCFYQCTGDISAIVAKTRRIPFVFNPYFYPPPSFKWKLYCRTLGRLAPKADVVIIISEFEREMIIQSKIPVKRFELVPPSINTREFEQVEEDVYAKYDIDRRKARVVLFVGRLHYSKGVDTLIAAIPLVIKREPETILFLAGPDWGNRKDFENQIEGLGIRRNVILAGQLSRRDLLSAYKGAALMVLPSRYEAFGIVLIEAMAARIPVVASNASAIPYVVSDGETGLLFPVDDHIALSNNILTLLRDDGMRCRMGQRGRKVVEKNFEREIQIARLEQIYESLM